MVTDPLFGKKKFLNLELEKDFQERVVTLLGLYGWKVYAVPDSRRVTLAGWPDLTCYHVKQRRTMFIELKREQGRVSVGQKIVMSELESIGHEVYLFRPSDWDRIERLAMGVE